LLEGIEFGPSTGFSFYRKRIKKTCPWVEFGYFNPYVGD
jgi:hypothetical protein